MHDLTRPPASGHDPLVVASRREVLAVAHASALTPDEAPTWDVAEKALVAPDRSFIVASYIHGGKPMNRNGHIFRVEELDNIHRYIPGTALDMFHNPQRVIGTHLASRVVRRHGAQADSFDDPDYSANPVVQILAMVWNYRHPQEARDIAQAFEANNAFVSHSCLPESVQCDVCGHKAPWDDYSSDLYCAHMQGTNAKWFNNPLFLGGAIIIPPVKPGWSDARISHVRRALAAHPDQAAETAAGLAALAGGNLTQLQLEVITGELLARAHAEDPAMANSIARLVGPGWEKAAAGYDGIDLTPPPVLAEALELTGEVTPSQLRQLVDLVLADDAPTGPAAAEITEWAVARWTEVVAADIAAMAPDPGRAGDDDAMSDGSFPIPNLPVLRRAMSAFESARNREATKRHLKNRAAKLGAPPALVEEIDRLGIIAEAAASDHTSAILAVVPPAEIAEAIAALSLGQFDADEVHVTLAFLGKVIGAGTDPGPEVPVHDLVQLDPESVPADRSTITGAVAAWALGQKRLSAKLSGRGTFDQGDRGETVYASVDCPGLDLLRTSLVAALEAAGVAVSHLHGFTPHMTITDGLPPGDGAQTAPSGQWTIDAVELWWAGDHQRIELP